MVKRYVREEVYGMLQEQVEKGKPILVATAGCGIAAKFAEAGGADIIITYMLAKLRMGGVSSMAGYLPVGDSNQILLELGEREIIPICKRKTCIWGSSWK